MNEISGRFLDFEEFDWEEAHVDVCEELRFEGLWKWRSASDDRLDGRLRFEGDPMGLSKVVYAKCRRRLMIEGEI